MSREAYLRGEFYHGTARRNLRFSPDLVAYLTQSRENAVRYAEMDAEVDQGTPHLLRVRLSCSSPAIMDTVTMQDLHIVHDHGGLVRRLKEQGRDCALSENAEHDEIAVLDATAIKVLETIALRSDRIAESPLDDPTVTGHHGRRDRWPGAAPASTGGTPMADILNIRSRLGVDEASRIHLHAADLLAAGDDDAGAWLLGDDRSTVSALCADLGRLLDSRRHGANESADRLIREMTATLAARLRRDEAYGLVVSSEELSSIELRIGCAAARSAGEAHDLRTNPRVAEAALA